jgi:hypothetical protein
MHSQDKTPDFGFLGYTALLGLYEYLLKTEKENLTFPISTNGLKRRHFL